MRKKLFLILIIVAVMAVILCACNGKGDSGDLSEPKYPMNQLPSDLLSPNGYKSVSDSFADGYKSFCFEFGKMNAAGEQRDRLTVDLQKKNYDLTFDGASNVLKKGDVEIRIRQSVAGEESKLYVSVPYDFYLRNLPAKMIDVPTFDGKLFNMPMVESESDYDAFTSVTVSLEYFEVSEQAANAFCRFMELEGYAFGKKLSECNVKVSTSVSGDKLFVKYLIDGFTSERDWETFVKALDKINFEKGSVTPIKLKIEDYEWVGEWLEKVGYSAAVPKPNSGRIKYNFVYSNKANKTVGAHVEISNFANGSAVSYCSRLISGGFKDAIWVDNEEKIKWLDIADKSQDFEWYGKFGLLLGKFVWKNDTKTFTIDLTRLAPNINDYAFDNCKNYKIVYTANNGSNPFTCIGNDYYYSISQNGTAVYRSSAPVFGDLVDIFRSQLFNAHLTAKNLAGLEVIEKSTYINRSVTIYEAVVNGELHRYTVDDLTDLTLKNEIGEKRSGEFVTKNILFEVSDFEIGQE